MHAGAHFEKLEAQAPGVLDRHLTSGSARDFYNVFRTARVYLQQDERQALTTAALVTKGTPDDKAEGPSRREIERRLEKFSGLRPWDDDFLSWGDAYNDVKHTAILFARAGLPLEDAVNRASDLVRKSHENINGFLVRTSDRGVQEFGAHLRSQGLQARPFADTVKDYLADYAKTANVALSRRDLSLPAHDPARWFGFTPGLSTTVGRLSIRRYTEGVGAWSIVDTATGMPVPIEGRRPDFTIGELVEFESARQRKVQDEEAERLAKASAERRRVRPVIETVDPPTP